MPTYAATAGVSRPRQALATHDPQEQPRDLARSSRDVFSDVVADPRFAALRPIVAPSNGGPRAARGTAVTAAVAAVVAATRAVATRAAGRRAPRLARAPAASRTRSESVTR